MLKWLFGGGKKKAGGGPQLCMPLLRSTDGITAARLIASWGRLFPTLPPATEIGDGPATSKASDTSVIGLKCGGADAFVALMPAKVPGTEVADAARMSWMWKREREKDLASYTAHAIVMTMSGSPLAAATLVTRVAACVVDAGDCVGVYWGNASLLHMPELFKAGAEDLLEEGQPAPLLWVNVLASADSPTGPYTLSTLGMEYFGLDEFEIVDSRAELGDLRERLYNLAGYVLENGPVLKDGHTVGNSVAERIKIRVGKSKLGKPGPVVRLEMA